MHPVFAIVLTLAVLTLMWAVIFRKSKPIPSLSILPPEPAARPFPAADVASPDITTGLHEPTTGPHPDPATGSPPAEASAPSHGPPLDLSSIEFLDAQDDQDEIPTEINSMDPKALYEALTGKPHTATVTAVRRAQAATATTRTDGLPDSRRQALLEARLKSRNVRYRVGTASILRCDLRTDLLEMEWQPTGNADPQLVLLLPRGLACLAALADNLAPRRGQSPLVHQRALLQAHAGMLGHLHAIEDALPATAPRALVDSVVNAIDETYGSLAAVVLRVFNAKLPCTLKLGFPEGEPLWVTSVEASADTARTQVS